ncbi:MAG: hypoxanthine phosphoribosyltransferase [Bacteroidales bacterium]|nr:hypoxanthine phosphoribosyltransferase [Bacteroidales bacterium]
MDGIIIEDRKFLLCLTGSQIETGIERIAREIYRDLEGADVLFLVVLNGAFMFAADLLRRIHIQAQVSFIRASSYKGMTSSGEVRLVMDPEAQLVNKVLVIIEDIVDTGLTLKSILDRVKEYHPASVKTAALLFKPGSYRMTIKPDYIGFHIPSRFVVGYGLDYKGFGRNLKDLYMLQETVL